MTQKEKLVEQVATVEQEVDRIIAKLNEYVKEEVDRLKDLIDELPEEDEDE